MPELGTVVSELQALAPDMDWTGTSLAADAPPWAEFGGRLDEASQAVARLARTGYMPGTDTEGDGLVAVLVKLTTWMDTAGPDLKALQPAIQPLARLRSRRSPEST